MCHQYYFCLCFVLPPLRLQYLYFTNYLQGYLEALGRTRTAEIQRDAIIGEAEAKKESLIRICQADEELLAARFANDRIIVQAKRDFEVKKAAYDQEVQAKVWFHHYLVLMLCYWIKACFSRYIKRI